MWTSTFYGNWQYWNNYHKVTFDGVNRLILVNNGVTSLDVKQDIYSDWKEWMGQEDHEKYTEAISSVGGEPIGNNQYVGSTFFLENGWRIRSWEGDHSLNVEGNLFTRESGQFPFVTTLGSYSVNYILARSQLVQAIQVGGTSTGSTAPTANEIATAVWNFNISQSFPTNTFGNYVSTKLLNVAQYLGIR